MRERSIRYISQNQHLTCIKHSKWKSWSIITHLVHRQIYTGVWDDAYDIGDVALVKRLHSLLLHDFLGAVEHPRVLSGLPQAQAGFQHLEGRISEMNQVAEV